MMKWIKNEVSYQEIAKNNTEEDLMAARHAVWYVEDEINGMVKSDEYDQNTMRKKFQEITGYKYNEIENILRILGQVNIRNLPQHMIIKSQNKELKEKP